MALNPAQQIEKWLQAIKLKRNADKKQKSSSKYHKLEISPEEISVFADELAKRNGTTPEEEAGKIQDAIDRDNAIEEATFAKNHPTMNMINEGGLVTGGGTPQTNQVIPQAKNVSAAATPDAKVEEEMKKAEEAQARIDASNNNANDTANTAITDSVSEAVTPKEGDTPEEHNAKNRYNKSMMSIWDAYRNGDIDKETAGYFTIDAIATLAKNLGRSIGNVGAQFSGGTIDNGHDESKWGQRQNALLNEEIGKETESLGGAAGRQAQSEILDIEAKKIRNAYTPEQLQNQIEMFKRELERADIDLDVAHSRTDLINFIKSGKDYEKSPFKMGLVAYLTQTGAAGAANNASKTLGDAINWVLTLAK